MSNRVLLSRLVSFACALTLTLHILTARPAGHICQTGGIPFRAASILEIGNGPCVHRGSNSTAASA